MAFAFAVLAVGGLWFVTSLIPSQDIRKLGDFDKGSLRVPLSFSERYKRVQLLIGATNHVEGSGQISVTENGVLVYEYHFDLEKLTPCNWLDGKHLHGLIIVWPMTDGQRPLEDIIHRNKSYDITVEIPETENSSLWFSGVK